MDVAEGGGRRRRSMSDEKIISSDLREQGDGDGRNSPASRSTFAVEKKPLANRTLLDIIKDDPNSGYKDNNKKSWKAFKDKLRLRRAGAAWTSTVLTPTSDIPIPNNYNRGGISRAQSTGIPNNSDDQSTAEEGSAADPNLALNNRAMMMRRNSSRVPAMGTGREGRFENSLHRDGSLYLGDPTKGDADEEEDDEEEDEEEEGEGEEETGESEDAKGGEPVRMSLMALLGDDDGNAYMMDDDDDYDEDGEDDEEEEEDNGGGEEKDYNNCCVCMVRHKGAAFIPCGHTFCRLCSRELYVQRGNCPLCNGFILEILDIF